MSLMSMDLGPAPDPDWTREGRHSIFHVYDRDQPLVEVLIGEMANHTRLRRNTFGEEFVFPQHRPEGAGPKIRVPSLLVLTSCKCGESGCTS